MFEPLRNAWKISDLRKKIFYTLFIIVLYRAGAMVSVPFVDLNALRDAFANLNNGLIDYMNVLAGGALEQASIFALSISPYINASIIIQLLTIAFPKLAEIQKDGEMGRKKINQITRFVTVALAVIQGFGYYTILRSSSADILTSTDWFPALVIVASFVAGSTLVMWLGESINDKGIGNGISMILFASIVSRGPQVVSSFVNMITNGDYLLIALVLVVFVLMIGFVIAMNDAERRLPINYAKRVVGRKMYGGQNTVLPIKISMTGVLPIIFAMTICQVPALFGQFWPNSGYAKFINNNFSSTSWVYMIIYFLLIIFFNYFYVSVQYDPVEIANNLQKNGGAVPGIRPGDTTAMYIKKTLSKITLIGAVFLGVIAITPLLLDRFFDVNLAIGGTSLLIVVSVVLETMKQIEAQMTMRNYKGFLD